MRFDDPTTRRSFNCTVYCPTSTSSSSLSSSSPSSEVNVDGLLPTVLKVGRRCGVLDLDDFLHTVRRSGKRRTCLLKLLPLAPREDGSHVVALALLFLSQL